MSLKDLTKDKHTAAESTRFMKAVFAKTLPHELWVDFTLQKSLFYGTIESAAQRVGLLNNIPNDILRVNKIRKDYFEMLSLGDNVSLQMPKTAIDYHNYIISLERENNPKRILAHLYTWHMGDLFGGQMIKQIVDAPHNGLEFEDRPALITAMRAVLTDDLADEANIAFDWAIKILESYDSRLEQN